MLWNFETSNRYDKYLYLLTCFIFITDGSGDTAMFPIAALLTGALLTIGVAVLLVVVLALKKNREQTHQNDGTKEKHIGKLMMMELVHNF